MQVMSICARCLGDQRATTQKSRANSFEGSTATSAFLVPGMFGQMEQRWGVGCFEATGAKNGGGDRGSGSRERRLTARWLEPFLWPFVPFSDFPGVAAGLYPPGTEWRSIRGRREKKHTHHILWFSFVVTSE